MLTRIWFYELTRNFNNFAPHLLSLYKLMSQAFNLECHHVTFKLLEYWKIVVSFVYLSVQTQPSSEYGIEDAFPQVGIEFYDQCSPRIAQSFNLAS
jgi:hypothetical protein